ncbi:MAG: hypothetical protein ABI595_03255 [Actinomycetota bacterium]
MLKAAMARSLPREGCSLIVQKGYEEVRDGRVAPTISETIAASRAMNAIERERLLAELDESRKKERLLMTLCGKSLPLHRFL